MSLDTQPVIPTPSSNAEQQTHVPLEQVPFWPCEMCKERLDGEG